MKDGVTWQQVHSYTRFSGDTGAEERMKRQTSVPGIEPGPSDWESSAPSDKTTRDKSLSPHSSLYAGSVR